jgi:hypothetical protein
LQTEGPSTITLFEGVTTLALNYLELHRFSHPLLALPELPLDNNLL